jgi:hypothetical protein
MNQGVETVRIAVERGGVWAGWWWLLAITAALVIVSAVAACVWLWWNRRDPLESASAALMRRASFTRGQRDDLARLAVASSIPNAALLISETAREEAHRRARAAAVRGGIPTP